MKIKTEEITSVIKQEIEQSVRFAKPFFFCPNRLGLLGCLTREVSAYPNRSLPWLKKLPKVRPDKTILRP